MMKWFQEVLFHAIIQRVFDVGDLLHGLTRLHQCLRCNKRSPAPAQLRLIAPVLSRNHPRLHFHRATPKQGLIVYTLSKVNIITVKWPSGQTGNIRDMMWINCQFIHELPFYHHAKAGFKMQNHKYIVSSCYTHTVVERR